MRKLSFSLLLFVFLCVGCSNESKVNGLTNKELHPSYFVLGNADSEIIYIDDNAQAIHTIKNENKFSQLILSDDKKYIYALSDGTYTAKKPYLFVYELATGKEVSKIELSTIPVNFVVADNKAYISTSVLQPDGVPFLVLDLKTKKETTFLTKGVVSGIKKDKNDVYLSVISGGKTMYGEYSNVYKVLSNGDTYSLTPLINEKIELPPSDICIKNGKLYAVFTGFAYGPKPDWVKEPEKYTDKFIVYDLTSGKEKKVINLSHSFPQKILKKGNDLLINHYTDIDMKGTGITVIDNETLEEKDFLLILNPAYVDYNPKDDVIVTSDPATSVVNFVNSDGTSKQLFIEGNCGVVRYVN